MRVKCIGAKPSAAWLKRECARDSVPPTRGVAMSFWFRTLSVCALTALMVQPVSANKSNDTMWEEGRAFLEPAGIDRQMFEVFSVWLEGQYHLGYCDRHLKASDVAFWRNWWEDTVLMQTEVGRMLLQRGTKLYERGLKAGGGADREICERVAGSWFKDMKATVTHSP